MTKATPRLTYCEYRNLIRTLAENLREYDSSEDDVNRLCEYADEFYQLGFEASKSFHKNAVNAWDDPVAVGKSSRTGGA